MIAVKLEHRHNISNKSEVNNETKQTQTVGIYNDEQNAASRTQLSKI